MLFGSLDSLSRASRAGLVRFVHAESLLQKISSRDPLKAPRRQELLGSIVIHPAASEAYDVQPSLDCYLDLTRFLLFSGRRRNVPMEIITKACRSVLRCLENEQGDRQSDGCRSVRNNRCYSHCIFTCRGNVRHSASFHDRLFRPVSGSATTWKMGAYGSSRFPGPIKNGPYSYHTTPRPWFSADKHARKKTLSGCMITVINFTTAITITVATSLLLYVYHYCHVYYCLDYDQHIITIIIYI